MTERLVRFGVAMEAPLLEEFDKVVERRGALEIITDLGDSAETHRGQIASSHGPLWFCDLKR